MTVLITRKETDKKEKQIENKDNRKNKNVLEALEQLLSFCALKG